MDAEASTAVGRPTEEKVSGDGGGDVWIWWYCSCRVCPTRTVFVMFNGIRRDRYGHTGPDTVLINGVGFSVVWRVTVVRR
ncbi:extensin-like [Iris pallida]|uniref:Extensin-like n=1 Tax=Iris pallida TaxID=29817 RepID=A0AAX6FM04_IRIPA|nr:extensin-like [Iris pallida]